MSEPHSIERYRRSLELIARKANVPFDATSDPEQIAMAVIRAIQPRSTPSTDAEPKIGQESRPISAAVRCIRLKGCARVTVESAQVPELVVRCRDQRALNKLLTTVSGDTLTIETEPITIRHSWGTMVFGGGVGSFVAGDLHVSQPSEFSLPTQGLSVPPEFEVTVRAPHIRDLAVSGAGSLAWKDVDLSTLGIRLSGSGTIELAGTVHHLEVEVSGAGELSAYALQTDTASVRVSGSGSARVTTRQAIQACVSGSGKIKVAGQPHDRDTNVTGSGKIKFKDRTPGTGPE